MLKKIFLFALLSIAMLVVAQNKKNEIIKIKTSAECEQCKKRLESNLIYQKGIKFCKLDVPSKVLTVTYNAEKTTPNAIRLAVSKLGYDADEVKADSLEYNKLPECCKKGGTDHE